MSAFDGLKLYRNNHNHTRDEIVKTDPLWLVSFMASTDHEWGADAREFYNDQYSALAAFESASKLNLFPSLEYIDECRRRFSIKKVQRSKNTIETFNKMYNN